MVAFCPTIGPVNADDLRANLISWTLYDGSKDSSPVSLGSFLSTTTGAAPSTDVTMLSSSLAVVVLIDTNNSDFPTAVLLDISGTAPSVLSSIVVKSAAATTIRVTKIDSRYAVVQFESSGSKARVLDTNSNTLTLVGSEQTATYGDSNGFYSICNLTSTQFVVFRKVTSTSIGCSVVDVNTGTGVVTYNTEVTLATSTLTTQSRFLATEVNTTKILVTYHLGTTEQCLTKIVTISGTTPTFVSGNLTTNIFGANPVEQFTCLTEAVDYFFISFWGTGSSDPNCLIAGTTSGASSSGETNHLMLGRGPILYMETVGNVQYFLHMDTVNIDASYTSGTPVLRSSTRDKTRKFFQPGTTSKGIGNGTSATYMQFNAHMRRISSSKVLITLKTSTSAHVAYIANL
jgi:hypothetical protein